jgi:transcriptional regulator with XRE-family HTH domain
VFCFFERSGFVDENVTFGSFIKEKRIARGWSLRFLAEKLAVSLTYLSDVETGKRYAFPKEKLLLLAEIFEIDTLEEKHLYLDLAAKTRDTVPLDVEEYILKNDILITFIRKLINKQFIATEYINDILRKLNSKKDDYNLK